MSTRQRTGLNISDQRKYIKRHNLQMRRHHSMPGFLGQMESTPCRSYVHHSVKNGVCSMNIALLGHGKMGKEVERIAREKGINVKKIFTIENNLGAIGLTRQSLAEVDVCI